MSFNFELSTSTDGLMSKESMKLLSERIHSDIDKFCVELYSDSEKRKHLGASVIGHDCTAYSWFHFRHAATASYSGRMLRLFDRGKREEERFLTWFRGIGFDVWDLDLRTGQQWRVTAAQGHFGGSLDSVAQAFQYFGNNPFLLEFKTKGTGSGFNSLIKNGVKVEQPRHYKQMCTYGAFYGMRYAVYAVINKNDDNLHIEVVELDWTIADIISKTATDIILAKIRPVRLAETPAFHVCKECEFLGVCHQGKAFDVNCRSCKFAEAGLNGTWVCGKFGQIPENFIPKACPQWEQIGK